MSECICHCPGAVHPPDAAGCFCPDCGGLVRLAEEAPPYRDDEPFPRPASVVRRPPYPARGMLRRPADREI